MFIRFSLLFFIFFTPLASFCDQHFDTGGALVAVDRYILCIRNSDFRGAYNLTSFDFRNETSLQKFLEFVDSQPVLINNYSLELGRLSLIGKSAIYEGRICSRNEEMEIKAEVVNENSQWKIRTMMLLTPKPHKVNEKADVKSTCLKCLNPNCKRNESRLKRAIKSLFNKD